VNKAKRNKKYISKLEYPDIKLFINDWDFTRNFQIIMFILSGKSKAQYVNFCQAEDCIKNPGPDHWCSRPWRGSFLRSSGRFLRDRFREGWPELSGGGCSPGKALTFCTSFRRQLKFGDEIMSLCQSEKSQRSEKHN
jgi:hypothetical protein